MSVNSSSEIVKKVISDMFLMKIDESSVKGIGDFLDAFMFDAKYSPDGRFLAIGSAGGAGYVLDVQTEKLHHVLSDHRSDIYGVAFSQDGKMLATCSWDNSIIIYNFADFSIFTQLNNDCGFLQVCFSHCCNYLYSTDGNGTVKKWNVNNSSVVLSKKIHSTQTWRLKLSLDNKYLLTGSDDKTAKVVDIQDFSVVHSFGSDNAVRSIDFHPTKKIVAIGDLSGKVKLYNLEDESVIYTFDFWGQPYCICFASPQILLGIAGNGYITLYDVESFQEIQKIHCNVDYAYFYCAISPNMTKLICGKCKDRPIKIYSIEHSYKPSSQSMIIELSKENDFVLSNILSKNPNNSIIRKLVAGGIYMNKEDFNLIINECWDLVDLNETNGGNMYKFMNVQSSETDEDVDD
eukprot:TRINITY_DN9862_c0_g1_i1.p1 TRINITY_DN9862_c0_g1~~TRINITY_DN9862_c0_g1_i1.p1  ORF type:complete len:416 (-),score=93.63 TRINITY_DN9862_c0_g1_i1:309-1520(-)